MSGDGSCAPDCPLLFQEIQSVLSQRGLDPREKGHMLICRSNGLEHQISVLLLFQMVPCLFLLMTSMGNMAQ